MTRPERVVVVGVGNLLLQDEGIGVHVAHALQEINPPGVELIDGGTVPDILTTREPADRLIIIDAANVGGAPGTVGIFHPDDLAEAPEGYVSLHDLGLQQSLKTMRLLGNEPGEVVIIGIQPHIIDWGTELSPELAGRLQKIVDTVLKEIGR